MSYESSSRIIKSFQSKMLIVRLHLSWIAGGVQGPDDDMDSPAMNGWQHLPHTGTRFSSKFRSS